MKSGTERIREIILSLRNFSRLDEAEFKQVDIHEGLDNTILILQHRLKATAKRSVIEIVRDYMQLPKVECFAGQLNQVFMNLLGNAIDAIDERVAQQQLTNTPITPGRIWIQTQVQPDATSQTEWITIQIVDNGSGMSAAVQVQVFNPFFTTKPIGKGTGLGLSISYQIVAEKHGGQMLC